MAKVNKNRALIRRPSHAVTSEKAALTRARKQILAEGAKLVRPHALARHRVLAMTTKILTGLLVLAFFMLMLAIYGWHSDSGVVYGISRVIPFPAAKVDSRFVSYADYLFEVRYRKNIYAHPTGPATASEQAVDFGSPESANLLKQINSDSLRQAKTNALVYTLAASHNVSISTDELNKAVNLWTDRQGGKDKFEAAIRQYYGWSIGDFRREYRQQLLEEKLQTVLLPDYNQAQKAKAADLKDRLNRGADFAALASTFSQDDGSKKAGGDVGYVTGDSPFVQEFKDAALALKKGQVSDIIVTQFGFHILKATDVQDGKVRISHILIKFGKDLNAVLAEKLTGARVHTFIRLPEPSAPATQ